MAVEVTRLCMVVVLVAAVFGLCACAPAVGEETVYDQRQNGTENFRLHISDVVIVHAPLEALLAVSGETPLQEQLMEMFSGASSTAGNDLFQPSTEASTSADRKTTAAEESISSSTSADTTTEQPQGQAEKPLKTR